MCAFVSKKRKKSRHGSREDERYPRVRHQVVIRHTPLGDYLLHGDAVLKIDDSVRDVVDRCDGCHTVEEIAAHLSEKTGEPKDEISTELGLLLKMLSEEKIIIYKDSPDYIPAIYSNDRPLSVVWEVTYACNQKCGYCISRAGAPDPDELSFEEIDCVLDELIELQVGLINITGGEPLLREDVVLHIARKASLNGVDLELLTNGMLITPEVAHALYRAGVRNAQVSLDCVQPSVHDRQRGTKGSWKKAVRGITNLRNAGIHVVGATVLTSENLAYFEETQAFLRNLTDTVHLGPVVPMGRGENNPWLLTPDMYYKMLELKNTRGTYLTDFIFPRERCSIGTTPTITPSGDVYPCIQTKYKELKLGNVRETSIRSIYSDSKLLQELFNCTVDRIEPCNSCWNRYYCGGGCRGCAFAFRGTIYASDPYQCEARKRFARKLLVRGIPEKKRALKALIRLTKKSKSD